MGSRPSAIAPPSTSGSTMASASISSAARQLSPGASGSPEPAALPRAEAEQRLDAVGPVLCAHLPPAVQHQQAGPELSQCHPAQRILHGQLLAAHQPHPAAQRPAQPLCQGAAQFQTGSAGHHPEYAHLGVGVQQLHTMQPLPVPAGRTSAAQFFCCSPASAARQAVLFESSTKIDISYPFCPFRGFRNSLFCKRNAPAQSWLSCLRCACVFPCKMLLSCSIFIIKVYFLSR